MLPRSMDAPPATAERAKLRLAERVNAGITRFQAGDRDELRDFARQHYGDNSYQAHPGFFAWRFEHTADQPAEGPMIWLCRRQGRVVGQQAGLPLSLAHGGQPLSAAWAIDLMVEAEWRLRGIAPAMTAQLCGHHALTAGLGIAPAARRAFARSGWLDLGRIPRYVRLLRPLRAGQTPTGRRRVGSAIAWASHAVTPLLALLAGLDAAALGVARLAGLRFEAIERFDERADAVWRATEHLHPLIARRDLAALAWRFDGAPEPGVYQRYYLMRGDRAVGYAVLRRRQDSMMVVDYLCDPRWRWALIAHCLRAARRDGASALRCLATSKGVQASLAAFGFLPRPGPYFMVHVDPAAGLSRDLVGTPANWFLTEADSDLDHNPVP